MKIRLHHDSELPWVRIGDMSKDPSVLTEAGVNSRIRSHEPGGEADPQLSEVDYAANVFGKQDFTLFPGYAGGSGLGIADRTFKPIDPPAVRLTISGPLNFTAPPIVNF